MKIIKSEVTNVIARWRVFLGFIAGIVFLFLSHVDHWPRAVGGLLIALLGLLLRGWAAGYLEKGKRLAQDGPYAWVRHPLYTGSFFMAVGFCVAGTGVVPTASVILWGVFLFLFGWIYPQRIIVEEQSLEKHFGDAWRTFTGRNRRFLPSLHPFRRENADRFQWSRYLKNKEYNAAVGWAAGTAVIVLKGIAGL
ncbi:MAG: isoprenylcysteine carboxylmethyltransferase family protein [Elusimicrobia bacterium]|nr:isoprenylcysteine carboxylmethyltransferase family protein [Elusimicrobiota bacterium]